MRKLTLKEKIFIQEYILTKNATQAAKNAGYSEKTARAIASENLTKPYILQAIKNERKKLEDEFVYSFVESFNKFEKAQELALEKKPHPDLMAFIKAEEQKGKLCGLYDVENRTEITVNYMGSVILSNGEPLKLKVGKEPPKD